MGDEAKWDNPRKRNATIVLQQHVVTEALEQGDVGGLFDFVMPAAKQQRSRDVPDTSLARELVLDAQLVSVRAV